MRHADPWDEAPRLEPLLEADLNAESRQSSHHGVRTYWEAPGHPHDWPTGHARPEQPRTGAGVALAVPPRHH